MFRRNSYRNPNVGGPHFICSLIHPASPSAAPSGLTVTGSTGQSPYLSWNASTGADGYKVYRCSNVSYSCSSYSYIGSTTSTNYTDFGKTVGNSCNGISGPFESTNRINVYTSRNLYKQLANSLNDWIILCPYGRSWLLNVF